MRKSFKESFIKNLILVSTLIILPSLISCSRSGNDEISMVNSRAIYGEDNREDISSKTLPKYLKWSKAVAGQIPAYRLRERRYGFKFSSYDENLCLEEKFSKQRTLPNCSGFLVAPDLLVTAGHCVNSETCPNSRWIFDYHIESKQYENEILDEKNVYACKSVIISKEGTLDYALIELDRKVGNRTPLVFRKKGKVSSRGKLVVIGHPSGLPLKITNGGKVIDNYSKNVFTTNLDTFNGNSGSPVFNESTGKVEGILVSGNTDYEQDPSGCRKSIEYDEYSGWERVTRISVLLELIKEEKKIRDLEDIKEIARYRIKKINKKIYNLSKKRKALRQDIDQYFTLTEESEELIFQIDKLEEDINTMEERALVTRGPIKRSRLRKKIKPFKDKKSDLGIELHNMRVTMDKTFQKWELESGDIHGLKIIRKKINIEIGELKRKVEAFQRDVLD
ncbi:MAG: hypothetical protein DRQ88_05355 [Epsilonproteobacteria bacterium]|nr:MAG: hypothetical protein DRQ88_05355 [Campylobacterota bacterium]